jgi:hypothetical protein
VSDTPAGPPDRSDASESTDDPDSDSQDRLGHGSEEEIDEVGDESFPASDAPQWWSGEPETDK